MTQKNMEKPNGERTENEALEGMDKEKFFDFDKANPDITEDAMDPATESGNKTSELQSTIQELKDKQLRLLAEFENYKKRTTRERLDLMNSASKEVILAFLPVLDDFERAKKSADDPNTGEHFSDGVNLVFNRFNATLQSLGLKVMESNGQPFDPEWHEAIMEVQVPDEEHERKSDGYD